MGLEMATQLGLNSFYEKGGREKGENCINNGVKYLKIASLWVIKSKNDLLFAKSDVSHQHVH